MNLKFAAKFFRVCLLFQFAVIGVGGLVMLAVIFVSNLRTTRIPLGLHSREQFFGLLCAFFVFALLHLVALIALVRRFSWASSIVAVACAIGLSLHITYAALFTRPSSTDLAYSALLAIELVLLFLPSIRSELGTRMSAA